MTATANFWLIKISRLEEFFESARPEPKVEKFVPNLTKLKHHTAFL